MSDMHILIMSENISDEWWFKRTNKDLQLNGALKKMRGMPYWYFEDASIYPFLKSFLSLERRSNFKEQTR